MLEEREQWRGHIESLKRMRQWMLDAEHVLDGSWAEPNDKNGIEPQDKNTIDALHSHLKNKKEMHRYQKKQYRPERLPDSKPVTKTAPDSADRIC